MDGQKNLAPATAKRVALALGLAGDAAEYFRLLVVLTQTSDPAERRAVQVSLGRLRRYQDVQALAEASDAYHRHWYLPAIRELSLTDVFRADPRWIARVLSPKILIREAKLALKTLEQLGLLRPDESGLRRAAHQQVGTELEPNSDQIANFHRVMIAQASQSLSVVPRPERDISSITLSVGAAGLPAIKKRIQEIRRELLDEFDAGKSGVHPNPPVVKLTFSGSEVDLSDAGCQVIGSSLEQFGQVQIFITTADSSIDVSGTLHVHGAPRDGYYASGPSRYANDSTTPGWAVDLSVTANGQFSGTLSFTSLVPSDAGAAVQELKINGPLDPSCVPGPDGGVIRASMPVSGGGTFNFPCWQRKGCGDWSAPTQ